MGGDCSTSTTGYGWSARGPSTWGVLDKLREVAPRDDKGHLKHKLFQRLMPDAGVPALREHLAPVTTITKLAYDWQWS